jgi:hypothetical protein
MDNRLWAGRKDAKLLIFPIVIRHIMANELRLSILDQTPIRKDSDAGAALQETVRLAKLADRLGYTR